MEAFHTVWVMLLLPRRSLQTLRFEGDRAAWGTPPNNRAADMHSQHSLTHRHHCLEPCTSSSTLAHSCEVMHTAAACPTGPEDSRAGTAAAQQATVSPSGSLTKPDLACCRERALSSSQPACKQCCRCQLPPADAWGDVRTVQQHACRAHSQPAPQGRQARTTQPLSAHTAG